MNGIFQTVPTERIIDGAHKMSDHIWRMEHVYKYGVENFVSEEELEKTARAIAQAKHNLGNLSRVLLRRALPFGGAGAALIAGWGFLTLPLTAIVAGGVMTIGTAVILTAGTALLAYGLTTYLSGVINARR